MIKEGLRLPVFRTSPLGPSFKPLPADRLKQNGVPVKIEELLLAASEASHVYSPCEIDAHSSERRTMRDRRDDKATVVLETEEPAIEEVIDARGKQQSVLTVESLLIGRVAPWFAMACNEMHGIFNAGDAAL